MNLNEAINQYFTRESIVNILASYELYYQIALGNFVYETLQDIPETNKKLEELNLQPAPSVILSNVYELIIHMCDRENFEERFEYYIRHRATLQALKDFVTKDEELLQVNDYIEEKSALITDDSFFSEAMYLQFESEYPSIYDYFDLFVTDEVTNQLREQFLSDERV